jgi:hypothetical protein
MPLACSLAASMARLVQAIGKGPGVGGGADSERPAAQAIQAVQHKASKRTVRVRVRRSKVTASSGPGALACNRFAYQQFTAI